MSAGESRQSTCQCFNAAATSAVVCVAVPSARVRLRGTRVHVGVAPG
jgi:hypothetical protein